MEIILGGIIIWLTTVVMSVGMEISNSLKIFKDVADNGYKIDTERIQEANQRFNLNKTKESKNLLVPGLNLLKAIERALNYNKRSWKYIDELRVTGALISMTKEEERIYSKNPTGFNAWMINSKIKIDEKDKIEKCIRTKGSKINYIEENGYYFITKTEGIASNLSLMEQRAILLEELSKREEARKKIEQEEKIKRIVEEQPFSKDEDNLRLTRKKREY